MSRSGKSIKTEYRLVALRAWEEGGISSVQSLSCCSFVSDSSTQWTAACWASLSITNFWSLFKFMSIESVMPSNHLILCHPLLLLLQCFPASGSFPMSQFFIRWPKYWYFGQYQYQYHFASVAKALAEFMVKTIKSEYSLIED